MRSNGGLTAFKNSGVRPIATMSSGRSSATRWHACEIAPSACLITSSMPAHACSISACQYSVRCRVVRDFSARHDGFRIELPGLGEVRLPPEVVEFEQGRATLAAGRRDHGRVDLPETVIPEVLVDCAERRVSNPEDRRHPLGSHPEVADIEEVLLT